MMPGSRASRFERTSFLSRSCWRARAELSHDEARKDCNRKHLCAGEAPNYAQAADRERDRGEHPGGGTDDPDPGPPRWQALRPGGGPAPAGGLQGAGGRDDHRISGPDPEALAAGSTPGHVWTAPERSLSSRTRFVPTQDVWLQLGEALNQSVHEAQTVDPESHCRDSTMRGGGDGLLKLFKPRLHKVATRGSSSSATYQH